jgi:hypothetical protein
MRALHGLSLGLSLVLAGGGCASICDEVADEAEAGGCAKGVLPEDLDEEATEELTSCEGEREARADCLLELTENVCNISDQEAEALAACYEAASQASDEIQRADQK